MVNSPYDPNFYSPYANPGYSDGDPWWFKSGRGGTWNFNDWQTWNSIKQVYKTYKSESGKHTLRLIDVGAGDGVWTVRLLLEFEQLTAVCIDPVPEFLKFAEDIVSRHYRQVLDRISFRYGELCHIPFETNAFDLGICLYDPLNHVRAVDHIHALQEFHRVVQGVCALSAHAIKAPVTCYVDSIENVSYIQQETGDTISFKRAGKLHRLPSYLFSAQEMLRLYPAAELTVLDFYGQDVLWSRMAPSSSAQMSLGEKKHLLKRERKFARDPNWIDYAAHLFFVSTKDKGTSLIVPPSRM